MQVIAIHSQLYSIIPLTVTDNMQIEKNVIQTLETDVFARYVAVEDRGRLRGFSSCFCYLGATRVTTRIVVRYDAASDEMFSLSRS